MTVGPGLCGLCTHRAYCGEVGECRPLVMFAPPDPRMAPDAGRCPTCRRVSYTPGRPDYCGWCRR